CRKFSKNKAKAQLPGTVFVLLPDPPLRAEILLNLTLSLARPRPPFLPSHSIAASMPSPVRLTCAPGALLETRTAPRIAPAKLRAPAGPPIFPILQRKESPGQQSQSSASQF